MTKKYPDWKVSAPTKIQKGKEEGTLWTPVGVGFNNKDTGKGISISLRLNLLSPTGDYVLFPYEPSERNT